MFLVHVGIGFQRLVTERHDVVIINRAEAAADVAEFVAPAFAAARVAVDDVVAVIRPVLHLVVVHRAIGQVRAAVNVENDRRLLARHMIGRRHHEAVNLYAVAVDELQRLRDNGRLGEEEVVVPAAQAGQLALRKAIQLLQAHVVHRHAVHRAVLHIEAVNRAVLLQQLLHLTRAVNAPQVRRIIYASQEVQVLPVRAHHIAAAHAAIAADGVADVDFVVRVAQEGARTRFEVQQQQVGTLCAAVPIHLRPAVGKRIAPERHAFDVIFILRQQASDFALLRVVAVNADKLFFNRFHHAARVGNLHALYAHFHHAEARRGDALEFFAVPEIQRLAGLVDDALAVEPEGIFIEHGADLIALLLRQTRREPLMPCQPFQRGFGRQVINAGEHNASIRQHAFERQGAFAAAYFFRRTARILAVQHGLPIRESVIRFDRHGIQQRFLALPAEALHAPRVRQTGIFAAFRVDAVEVGVVAILCEVRRRRDIGDLLPVGADLHLREEIIHKKIIKLKLFHAISCLSGRGDRRCVRNKMGNWVLVVGKFLALF